MLGSSAKKGKENHIGAISKLPFNKIKGDGTWGAKAILNRNRFVNFVGKTALMNMQSLFTINPYASDLQPVHEFIDTTFENIDSDAFGYLMDPPEAWANVKDCGEFPCTAPWNTLLSFKRTKFTGQRGPIADPDF